MPRVVVDDDPRGHGRSRGHRPRRQHHPGRQGCWGTVGCCREWLAGPGRGGDRDGRGGGYGLDRRQRRGGGGGGRGERGPGCDDRGGGAWGEVGAAALAGGLGREAVVPSGVIAMAEWAECPTLTGVSGVLVAVRIGVTVAEAKLAT